MGVEDLIVPAVVSGAVLAAAGLLSWSFYRRFYLAVPPNQALVLYGGRRTSPRSTGVEVSESVSIRSPRILVGGGAFVGPWNRGAGVLALELIDVDVNVRTGTVRAGHAGLGWEARVALEVKIPTDPQALLAAAEHLFGKSSEEIRELVRHVVEGSIPAVVQRLHLGETEFDLEQVATEIQAVVAADLLPSGLSIRSLAVRELRPIRPVEPGRPVSPDPQNGLSPDLRIAAGEARAWLAGVELRLARVERSLGIMGAEIVRLAREAPGWTMDAGSMPVFDYPLGTAGGPAELPPEPLQDLSHDSMGDDRSPLAPRTAARGSTGAGEGGPRPLLDTERG